ncbi:SIS domain-containing protein [Lapillicoccus sp.]|uniref:SIS domain-containing protein n=1 Tax=Lapillicoccus sp. TaxID=1909287 RepID=UPI003983A78C
MPVLDEARIDDEEAIAALDSRQTLRSLAMAGAQVRQAIDLTADAGVQRVGGGDRPRSVLVASLGGSAVVADVLELLAEPGSPVPVHVRRNLPLPGWVGALDLVVAVSQSGRAEGPLALAAEAARRGASLLTVGAPRSPLAHLCAQARGIHVDIPAGLTSSRTSLWALLTPVVIAAGALGLVDADPGVLARVADRLDLQAGLFRPGSESFVNPAKLLAAELADGVPVVLGDGPLTGVAAARAASMLARTARMPATWGELPDAASQIVACFDGPWTDAAEQAAGRPPGGDIFADPYLDAPASPRLRLLMLRDGGAGAEEVAAARLLADAVVQTAQDAGVRVSQHSSDPGHPLERLAGHVALTDFAATYLAIGLGMDPGLSPHVADLRERTRD